MRTALYTINVNVTPFAQDSVLNNTGEYTLVIFFINFSKSQKPALQLANYFDNHCNGI